jgi:hypothetical protein
MCVNNVTFFNGWECVPCTPCPEFFKTFSECTAFGDRTCVFDEGRCPWRTIRTPVASSSPLPLCVRLDV